MTQGYLRAWETKQRLWVYDREMHRSFQSQAKSVANETELYSRDVESKLAKELDDPAVLALRSFSEGKPLSPEDRELVARFLFVQWKRTPRARERVISTMPAAEGEVERELLAEIDRAAALDSEFARRAEGLREQVCKVLRDRTHEERTALWQQLVLETTGPLVHQVIKSMNWVLVRAPANSLLTCDNPMYFHEHEGLGGEQSELTFPLSPTTALWATRGPIPNGAILKESASMAREINRRTAHNSARWVFFSTPQPWIDPFIKKGSWSLNRIRR